jgi:hypothetical protein
MTDELELAFIEAPRERDTVLTQPPLYVEAGTGKTLERWHAVSTLCPQCGQRLVHATTPDGTPLALVVSARAWRPRLNAQKDGYIAERVWGYPEHTCGVTPPPRQETTP